MLVEIWNKQSNSTAELQALTEYKEQQDNQTKGE
jgi:hypothetical protein